MFAVTTTGFRVQVVIFMAQLPLMVLCCFIEFFCNWILPWELGFLSFGLSSADKGRLKQSLNNASPPFWFLLFVFSYDGSGKHVW